MTSPGRIWSRATRRDMPRARSGGRWTRPRTCSIARSDDPGGRAAAAGRGRTARPIHGDAATTFAHERRIADLQGTAGGPSAPVRRTRRRTVRPRTSTGTRPLAALVTAGARVRDSAGSARPVGPLPPVRPGQRGRLHLPVQGGPARLPRPPGNVRHLLGCHVRVRCLQAVRCRVPVRFRAAHLGRAGLRAPAAPHRTPDLATRRGRARGRRRGRRDPRGSRAARSTPTTPFSARSAAPCHAAGTTTCTGVACGGALLWPVRRLIHGQDTVSGCLCLRRARRGHGPPVRNRR